jgi:CIC family chloride channel protein
MIGWLVPAVVAASGAALSVWLVRRHAPETKGSGIPHVEAVLQGYHILNWMRVIPIKFLGGLLSIGGGLLLGREGPTVQMGAAAGDAVGQWTGCTPSERKTLTAAGGGAGLAAAFNAPLSGVVFALEELERGFRPALLGAAFVASAIADILMRSLAGQRPEFLLPTFSAPPLVTLPAFAVLGILAGLLGALYNACLPRALNLADHFRGKAAIGFAAALGAVVGLAAWFNPLLAGGGQEVVNQTLDNRLALGTIPLLLLARFVLSIGSYATGAPGGIFAPLLALGALLGLAVGELTLHVLPWLTVPPAVFAIVGMAALFAAIVRAPLTGIVLILEMTGTYEQMLSLLVATSCAYAVAEALRSRPIYETLLERDLQRASVPR